MPISAGLAKRLKALAAGRDASEPLLLNRTANAGARQLTAGRLSGRARPPDCRPRDDLLLEAHRDHPRAARRRAGASGRVVVRHLVAMIEKTYSKHIADHGDELMRRALFDVDAPAGGNVVPMAR